MEEYREDEYGFVDILNVRSCYPSVKRASETLCVAYGREFGVDAVIVRPGHIYGPTMMEGDTKASSEFSRKATDREHIVMKSAGNQLRSYCYTADCATAILAVLLNGKSLNAYNVSNPNSICTVREIAECFAETGGSQIVFENPSDAEKANFNHMSSSALNSEKLCALGWKGRFDRKTGVAHTISILRGE